MRTVALLSLALLGCSFAGGCDSAARAAREWKLKDLERFRQVKQWVCDTGRKDPKGAPIVFVLSCPPGGLTHVDGFTVQGEFYLGEMIGGRTSRGFPEFCDFIEDGGRRGFAFDRMEGDEHFCVFYEFTGDALTLTATQPFFWGANEFTSGVFRPVTVGPEKGAP
jgi:hypothetical protein